MTATNLLKEEYHAYIACCHKDKKVDKFAKTLKQDLTSKGFKCVSDEDDEIGHSTVNTICSNIEMTRRVVLLISSKNTEYILVAMFIFSCR